MIRGFIIDRCIRGCEPWKRSCATSGPSRCRDAKNATKKKLGLDDRIGKLVNNIGDKDLSWMMRIPLVSDGLSL
jgi:hypothetical protein